MLTFLLAIVRHACAKCRISNAPDPKSKISYRERKTLAYCGLNGIISPHSLMSLAAGYSRVLLPLRFDLSSALQYEIVMLSVIEHPHSLQTSKRNPSSSPAYPVRRSDQHLQILPRQSEGASRIVVHSRLIAEAGVNVQNLDSACHYSRIE
jgi:hypothetical protein